MTGAVVGAAVAGAAILATAQGLRGATIAVPSGRVRRRLAGGDLDAAHPWPSVRRGAEAVVDVVVERVGHQLRAADLATDPRPVVAQWVAATGLLVVLAVGRWGTTGLVVAAVAVGGGSAAVLAWRRGRSGQRYAAALPVVLEACAGRLRAGASLAEAVGSAAADPTGSSALDADLRQLSRRLSHGQPFAEAVEAWATDRAVPGLGLVAAALVLGAEAGGARAQALDGVAATLRDRRAVAAEVDALSSQARASAVVMMGAPVAFAALGLLGDPEVSAFLLRTPAGLACLGGGLVLDTLAGVWMLRIARSAR